MSREGKHVPSASTWRCVQMLDLIKCSLLRRKNTFCDPRGFLTPFAQRFCSTKSGPLASTNKDGIGKEG